MFLEMLCCEGNNVSQNRSAEGHMKDPTDFSSFPNSFLPGVCVVSVTTMRRNVILTLGIVFVKTTPLERTAQVAKKVSMEIRHLVPKTTVSRVRVSLGTSAFRLV